MLFRKVERVEFFRLPHTGPMYGGGKNLILECGHKLRRKYSEPTPKMAHCDECWNNMKASNGPLEPPR